MGVVFSLHHVSFSWDPRMTKNLKICQRNGKFGYLLIGFLTVGCNISPNPTIGTGLIVHAGG